MKSKIIKIRWNLENYGRKKLEKHPLAKKIIRPVYIFVKSTGVFLTNLFRKTEPLFFEEIKKIVYVPYLGTEPKGKIFTKKYQNNWTYKLKKIVEKNKMEITTNDVLNAKNADAVIFFDNLYYNNLNVMWDLFYNRKLHSSVYIDYEPPTGHCKNHSPKGIRMLSNIFKKVITFNDDLVDGKNIIKGCIGDNWGNGIKYKNDFKKRKLLVMITNNTSTNAIINILNYWNSSSYFNSRNIKPHKNQIYSKREEAVSYFANKCPKQFDLYGVNWPDKYKKVIREYLPRKEKTKTISKYKFILSYDSMINQRGYISEKIFDAFKAKTVPIYWGANNVADYIPKECFIDKRDFNTYEELYNYIANMSEKEYNKRIEAIEQYLKSEQYNNLFSSKASANIIYDALMTRRNNFSYRKAYKSLMKLQKKKNKVDKHKSILIFSALDSRNEKMVFLKGIHIGFEKDNMNFVVKKNDEPIVTTDYCKEIIENSEAYEHSFLTCINYLGYKDKISIYIRKDDYLIPLRIKEPSKGYLSSMKLKVSSNGLYLMRSKY